MYSPSTHDLDITLSVERTTSLPPVTAGERWVDKNDRVFAWSHWSDGEGRLKIAGTGVFYLDHSQVVRAYVEKNVPAARVEADFLRVVRPLLLLSRGWQVLHASAVLTEHGVVGLCGRSGAGKSTVARAWATTKSRLWADDALITRDRVTASPEAIRVPLRLEGSAERPRSGAVRPLVALVVLEVDQRSEHSPTLERLRPTSALSALLPHALCFDSTQQDLRQSLFEAYSSLARKVAVLRLRYYQTPSAAQGVVRSLQGELLRLRKASAEESDGRAPRIGPVPNHDRGAKRTFLGRG